MLRRPAHALLGALDHRQPHLFRGIGQQPCLTAAEPQGGDVRLQIADVADVLDVQDQHGAEQLRRVVSQILGQGIEAVDLIVTR